MCKFSNICSDYPEHSHFIEDKEECDLTGCCSGYYRIRDSRIDDKQREIMICESYKSCRYAEGCYHGKYHVRNITCKEECKNGVCKDMIL